MAPRKWSHAAQTGHMSAQRRTRVDTAEMAHPQHISVAFFCDVMFVYMLMSHAQTQQRTTGNDPPTTITTTATGSLQFFGPTVDECCRALRIPLLSMIRSLSVVCVLHDAALGSTLLSSTDSFHCFVSDVGGEVRCWGENSKNQLGQGHTDRIDDLSGLPAIDLGQDMEVKSLAVGSSNRHMCTILENGKLKCWGRNEWGELGSE